MQIANFTLFNISSNHLKIEIKEMKKVQENNNVQPGSGSEY